MLFQRRGNKDKRRLIEAVVGPVKLQHAEDQLRALAHSSRVLREAARFPGRMDS